MQEQNATPSRFEPWMLVQVGYGMAQFAFLPMLIVAFVTGATGNPKDGGIVLSTVGLAALVAPAIGRFADEYSAHRLSLTAGLLFMAISIGLYAWEALGLAGYVFAALIFGIGLAAIQAVGPAFVLSVGGVSDDVKSRKLAFYYMMTSVGLLIGGFLLAIISDWTFRQQFGIGALALGLIAVFVWFAAEAPSKRIVPRQAEAGAEASEDQRSRNLREVFGTRFGILLLMAFFAGAAYNAFVGQIANIMGQTFDWSSSDTSLVLGVAGLINVAGYLIAGRWMARSGALAVATGAQVLHIAGLTGLALLSLAAGPAGIIVAVAALTFYLGEPYGRIPQPVLSERFSTMPVSTATGWYIAALAGAGAVGNLTAGVLAQTFDYSAIIWMALVSFVIAIGVNIVGLWPVVRKRRAELAAEPGTVTPAPADPS